MNDVEHIVEKLELTYRTSTKILYLEKSYVILFFYIRI